MRELKGLKVRSVALVPGSKNHLPVYFPVSDMVELDTLVLNPADGTLTVLVFDLGATFLDDCAVAPDALRAMAHDFVRSGAKLERYHTRTPLSSRDAAVVESFIVQPGDPRFTDVLDHENKPVDVTGAWALVIRLYDRGLQLLYRGDHAWSGVSIFAEAVFDHKPEIIDDSPVSLKFAMSRAAV